MVSLDCLLANRRWIRREQPFPHVVAGNVFTERFYSSLVEDFFGHFACEAPGGLKDPTLRMKEYDAYGLHFSSTTRGPLSIFLSRSWHDLLASLFQVKASGFVNAGLHHHEVDSRSGLVHNDLSIGWFVEYPSANGIRIPRHDLCRYTDGTALAPAVLPTAMVRAVSMLFYLANPTWSPGDGGETGLYRCAEDNVERPVEKVPPINNSILVFECTPLSYHSFLCNRKSVRNSVIMWIHRSKNDATRLWGEERLVRFPREAS